jgi:hypothetical protein
MIASDPITGVHDSEVRIMLRRLVCELRNRKDTGKSLLLVWLWFRSPHNEFAGCNDAGF